MRIGLTVNGTTYAMGLRHDAGRTAIRPKELLDRAAAAGLEGAEIPVSLMAEEDAAALGRYAAQRGLYINLGASGYNPVVLAEAVRLAEAAGARTVRTTVGGAKLGGDRRPLAGKWQPFLQEVLEGLRETVELAERAGVCLAVENHQDLASEELLWLCETIDSPAFGLTLDSGNPLATAEDPLDFAARLAPHFKNVHLKDYTIYISEEGYRLVRCPLGRGVIDFPALLGLFAETCPDITMSIELAALEARHVRVLAEDYWPDYPPRSAASLARVLRFAQERARPAGEDWRTPFEQGEPPERIASYEEEELAVSLDYIVPLFRSFSEKEGGAR